MSESDDIVDTLDHEEITVHTYGKEYQRSVAISNLMYRFERPDCVVQPKRTSQIQLVIKEAKKRNIRVIIKNGGHSYAGGSTASQGISLDLRHMNKVSLNADHTVMTLQGGATWLHAYNLLVEKKINGVMINGGRCPTVGVSGFILGGGLGPFTRSVGMGCDCLEEVTLVTADGEKVVVRAKNDDDPAKDQLFKALCGAGGGNFGVVVEMKLRLQKLRDKEVIVAGIYLWLPKSCKELMETMNAFYSTEWPEALTIDTSWVCDLRRNNGNTAIRFLVYHNGNKKEFDDIITDKIKGELVVKQLRRRTSEQPSSLFLYETLAKQWSEEILHSMPDAPSYRIYASFVFNAFESPEQVSLVTKAIQEEMDAFKVEFEGEAAVLQVSWIHSGGKATELSSDATAFPWRSGRYFTYIMCQWFEAFLVPEMEVFLTKFKQKLSLLGAEKHIPLAGPNATFINFPDKNLPQNIHEEAYFGENKGWIKDVKRRWDKDNYFQWSQGISPDEQGGLHRGGQTEAGEADESKEALPPSNAMPKRGIRRVREERAETDRRKREQWGIFKPVKESFIKRNDVYSLDDLWEDLWN